MDDNTGDGVISTGNRKLQPLCNKNLDCYNDCIIIQEDSVTLRSELFLLRLKESKHSKHRVIHKSVKHVRKLADATVE